MEFEFREIDIARLVLGYLKEEKCQKAFEEFLIASRHLQDFCLKFQQGKLFGTRVGGWSLVDYLAEYAEIYSMVSARIEMSDYYRNTSGQRKRPSLAQQLSYLFGTDDSRSNSPAMESRIVTCTKQDRVIVKFSENLGIDESFETEEDVEEELNLIEKSPEEDCCLPFNQIAQPEGSTPIKDPLNTDMEITNSLVGTNTDSGLLIHTQTHLTPQPYGVLGPPATYVDAPPIKTVFTEQDILTMPTIIVCDQNPMPKTQVINITDDTFATSTPALRKIAPKEVEKPKTIIEMIKRCNNKPSPLKDLKKYKKRGRFLPKKNDKRQVKENAKDIQIDVLPELHTPIVNTERQEKRVTPHSGGSQSSHVRQLNFSTPEKLTGFRNLQSVCEGDEVPNAKKTKTEDSSLNSVDVPVTNRVHDEQLTEESNILGSMTNGSTFKKTKSNEILNRNPWDADLRALAISNEKPKSPVSKSKRKRSKETSNNHTSAPKKPKQDINILNTTEQNAFTIESMLKSPEQLPVASNTDTISTVVEGDSNNVVLKPPKPKQRKKCNLGNSDKKGLHEAEQIVLTSITKVASCEMIEDIRNKVILSPSKMNVSKRNILLEQTKDEQYQNTTHKQMSPELSTATNSMGMPLLETPVKSHSMVSVSELFGTPAISTPFTKAVIDQLGDVDINAINTPKFPITPSFSLTPFVGKEPTPPGTKGGTDYSTSSSYYQPSETEQSKSLEQLLKECKQQEAVPPSQTDKLAAFNQQLVGRKNMNILKTAADNLEISSSSCSTSSSSDSSSESDSDSSCYCAVSKVDNRQDSPDNNTEQRYSFRPRKTTTPTESNPPQKVKTPDSNPPKIVKTHQETLLEEMAEKRLRTIARIKSSGNKASKETSKAKKPPVRRPSNSSSARKTPAVKKQQRNSFTQGSATVIHNNEVVLHLEDNDEMSLEPFHLVQATLQEPGSTTGGNDDKTENDEDQQDILVKGLKERGIHLIPTKKKAVAEPVVTTSTETLKEKGIDDTSASAEPIPAQEETTKPIAEERKKETVECPAVSNLEEGEIVSEEEEPKTSKNKTISKSSSRNRDDKKRTVDKPSYRSKDRHTKKPSTNRSLNKLEATAGFQVKTFDRETLRIKHDYNTKCTRSLADYDLDILNKTISANVYIEEQDITVTKLLSVTDTHFVLDIPSAHSDADPMRKSSLDGLYPEDTVKYKCNSSDIQHKITERKHTEQLKDAKSRKHSESAKESKRNKSPEKNKAKETSRSRSKSRPKTTTVATPEAEKNSSSINDDLMNYALVGSIRETDSNEFDFSANSSFRQHSTISISQASIQDGNQTTRDTGDGRELLRTIDVDSFLKTLHGDT